MKVIKSLVSIDSCKKVGESGAAVKRQARVAAEAVRAKSERFFLFIEYYIRILL